MKSLPLILAVIILIVVGIGLWFIFANSTPPVPGTEPEPGVAGETKGHITTNEQYAEIEASYPQKTSLANSAGAAADAEASAAMKGFVEAEIQRFRENSGLSTLTPADITMWGLDQGRKFALDIDYTTYTSPSTVSFVFTIYADTLGAHPNGYYRTFTFDAASGTDLELGDLFVSGENYLSVLSQKSRASLSTKLGPDADTDYIASGTTPDADNFQSFYVTANALVLIFPPYQVGPYAIGSQEVSIPKSELSTILAAEYR